MTTLMADVTNEVKAAVVKGSIEMVVERTSTHEIQVEEKTSKESIRTAILH